MLRSNLGSPSLHLPAPLLLLVFHLRLGCSRIAQRRQDGLETDFALFTLPPFTHSPPHPPYTQLSAPPRQSGAPCGPAHARSSDAPRAESHLSCPQLVR